MSRSHSDDARDELPDLGLIVEGEGRTRVVDRCDVVVVGGGPAGVAAAVAAARNGVSVCLIERYPYLGGLASGGMVLVLDDLANEFEISVRGITSEYIDRLVHIGLAVVPPENDWGNNLASWQKWSRWGVFDFRGGGSRKPITYAAAFDPDGWKRVSNDLVSECGVRLRLHSWFSTIVVNDGHARGVICETKSGREAVLADVVIDATGDLDVASRAGADFTKGQYLVTPVFRLGGVDTEAAERFLLEEPGQAAKVSREAKRILGGAWDIWWMRTPLPGVIWCNCPHMRDIDATRAEDLTAAELGGRRLIVRLFDYVRGSWPGFERSFIIDVAPQLGVRQTLLLEGEYVVTKEDILLRRHFRDSVARGRDYYTPYRALIPKRIDGLLVAGRHYSATPDAQLISREIGPCIAMGEACGVAAAIALDSGVTVRSVDVALVQRRLREQGADPGDVPSPNALVES